MQISEEKILKYLQKNIHILLTNILCYTCAGRLRADVLIAFATLLTLGWSSLPIMKCNVIIVIIAILIIIICIIVIIAIVVLMDI